MARFDVGVLSNAIIEPQKNQETLPAQFQTEHPSKHIYIVRSLVALMNDIGHVETIRDTILKVWGDLLDPEKTTIFGKTITDHELKGSELSAISSFVGKEIADRMHQEKPETWRKGIENSKEGREKDVVNISNNWFSFEIKVSSRMHHISGHQYDEVSDLNNDELKKSKQGYFVVVTYDQETFEIVQIRLGWLDDMDWVGSNAKTSSAGRINKEVQDRRFIEIYPEMNL